MSRHKRMLEALQKLEPIEIKLIDDSESHKGHSGYSASGESHYSLYIVSHKFNGLGRIERQRLVNEVLASEFKNGLHALTMKLLSTDENK